MKCGLKSKEIIEISDIHSISGKQTTRETNDMQGSKVLQNQGKKMYIL